jgi:hypothetical protein
LWKTDINHKSRKEHEGIRKKPGGLCVLCGKVVILKLTNTIEVIFVANKKNQGKTKSEIRNLRIQQIIFLTISIMIILAMVLSMAMKF